MKSFVRKKILDQIYKNIKLFMEGYKKNVMDYLKDYLKSLNLDISKIENNYKTEPYLNIKSGLRYFKQFITYQLG